MMRAFFIDSLFHVSTKCRKTFNHLLTLSFFISSCLTLISCSNDEFDLPDTPLEGKISGSEWSSDKANAYNFSGGVNFEVKFLSSDEPGSDPCSAPSPSRPHLSAVFRPAEGSFSFSSVLIDPNQAIVRIHPTTSSEFVITDGFMEIYIIDSGIMYGYIQAILDDENTLEGSFEVRFCN